MLYQLEKWYFDFLTPGGDYFFGYFAQVSLLGMRTNELALHLRRAGTDRPTIWTGRFPATIEEREGDTRRVNLAHGWLEFGPVAPSSESDIEPQRTQRVRNRVRTSPISVCSVPSVVNPVSYPGSSINIELPDAAVKLTYAALPILDPGLVIPARRGAILWQPLMLGAGVEGEVRLHGESVAASGTRGYVDFLRSTVLPPSVPVRTLCWGRAHGPRCDLTYTIAIGIDDAWSRLVVRVGDRVLSATDVTVEPAEWEVSPVLGIRFPSRYRLLASGPGLRVEADVVRDRAAVESQFISGPSFLRRITRNPRGVKCTGRAFAKVEHDGTRVEAELPMVDEHAIFD